MEGGKSFLEKLQSADEHTKTRWLVVSSAVAMLIVIAVWLLYFNTLVSGFSAPQPPMLPSGGEQGFSFWQTMENGAAIVYQNFVDKLEALGTVLRAPREYIIEPPR